MTTSKILIKSSAPEGLTAFFVALMGTQDVYM